VGHKHVLGLRQIGELGQGAPAVFRGGQPSAREAGVERAHTSEVAG
jgi:hypothetical protein